MDSLKKISESLDEKELAKDREVVQTVFPGYDTTQFLRSAYEKLVMKQISLAVKESQAYDFNTWTFIQRFVNKVKSFCHIDQSQIDEKAAQTLYSMIRSEISQAEASILDRL